MVYKDMTRWMPYAAGLAANYMQPTSGPVYGPINRPFQPRGAIRTIKKAKRRRAGYNTLKRQILNIESAKHMTDQPTAVPGGNMTMNTLYTYNVTSKVAQGTGVNQRIGDSIYLEALKIRGNYIVPQDAGGYVARILVGYSGEEYSATGFASGLGTGEVFHAPTANAWSPNGLINSKAFTVLYDQTIDINTLTTTNEELSSFVATVPLKKDHDYQAAASIYGKKTNLYIVVVGAAVGGSSGTTNVGNIIMSLDLIFK